MPLSKFVCYTASLLFTLNATVPYILMPYYCTHNSKKKQTIYTMLLPSHELVCVSNKYAPQMPHIQIAQSELMVEYAITYATYKLPAFNDLFRNVIHRC